MDVVLLGLILALHDSLPRTSDRLVNNLFRYREMSVAAPDFALIRLPGPNAARAREHKTKFARWRDSAASGSQTHNTLHLQKEKMT
jgi:hypothetical protein